MEETTGENDFIRFRICDSYYPQNRMSWRLKSSLLFSELFDERIKVNSNTSVGISADNIDQLCFDLSESYEIMFIECVGFRFQFDDHLIAPIPTRQGNLILTNPPVETKAQDDADLSPFGLYSLDGHLELTCTQDRMLLRIGINTQAVTEIVAASEHVIYTLAGDTLQEIWFLNPTVNYE